MVNGSCQARDFHSLQTCKNAAAAHQAEKELLLYGLMLINMKALNSCGNFKRIKPTLYMINGLAFNVWGIFLGNHQGLCKAYHIQKPAERVYYF